MEEKCMGERCMGDAWESKGDANVLESWPSCPPPQHFPLLPAPALTVFVEQPLVGGEGLLDEFRPCTRTREGQKSV